jgi:hypothetical protein
MPSSSTHHIKKEDQMTNKLASLAFGAAILVSMSTPMFAQGVGGPSSGETPN